MASWRWMNSPPTGARVAALILAFLNVFGLLFFGGYYFSAEHRWDLLIYAIPIIALVAGGRIDKADRRCRATATPDGKHGANG